MKRQWLLTLVCIKNLVKSLKCDWYINFYYKNISSKHQLETLFIIYTDNKN